MKPPAAASSITSTATIRELLTNYGKIDVLWYDVSWPLDARKAGNRKR